MSFCLKKSGHESLLQRRRRRNVDAKYASASMQSGGPRRRAHDARRRPHTGRALARVHGRGPIATGGASGAAQREVDLLSSSFSDAELVAIMVSAPGAAARPPPSQPQPVEKDPFLVDAVAALGERRGTLLNSLDEAGAGRIDKWPAWARALVLASRTRMKCMGIASSRSCILTHKTYSDICLLPPISWWKCTGRCKSLGGRSASCALRRAPCVSDPPAHEE